MGLSAISSVPITSVALRHSVVSPTLLISGGSLPPRVRSHQQVRDFRLDIWSSYPELTLQKDCQRRYRRLAKYKHTEALNGNLSWDRHSPVASRETGLKGFMCSAWRGQDNRLGRKWFKLNELKIMNGFRQQGSDAETKNERNRASSQMNNRDSLYDFIRAGSHVFDQGWSSSSTRFIAPASYASTTSDLSPKDCSNPTAYAREGLRGRFSSNKLTPVCPHNDIDPITNRRLAANSHTSNKKSHKSDDIPVKTLKAYESQFHEFESQISMAERSATSSSPGFYSLRERLRKKYNEKSHLEASQARANGSREEDAANENQESEGPVKKSYSIEEGLRNYDQKVDYESGGFYDCVGIAVDYSDPVQSGLKDYDNKISQGKACPESDIVKKAGCTKPIEHRIAEFNVKPGYRSGLVSAELGEKLEQRDRVSEAISDFKSRAKQSLLVESSDTQPHRMDPIQQAFREYENSDLYRQKRKKKQGDALVKAIQDYETDHPRFLTKLTGSVPDIEKLNPVLKAIHEYEITASEAGEIFGNEEPFDPILNAFRQYRAISASHGALDMKSLSPVLEAHRPLQRLLKTIKEHRASTLRSDLSSSQQGNRCPVQEGLQAYDEKVDNYRKPLDSGKWAFKPIIEDTIEDLDLLRASDVRAASGIIKISAKQTEAENLVKRKELERDFERLHSVEEYTSDENAAAKKIKETRKLVEDLRIEHSELLNHAAHARGRIDAKIAEVEAGWQPEKPAKKLTGNFIRDFPEHFEETWTTRNPGSETLVFESKAGRDVETDLHIIGLAPKDSFSRNPGTLRMETSMDRLFARKFERKSEQMLQGEGDLSPNVKAVLTPESQQKPGQVTSAYDAFRESKKRDVGLVREVASMYEDAYETIDTTHCQVPASSEGSIEMEAARSEPAGGQTLDPFINTSEPTLVSTAETTSIVPDASNPLTPAEVLLRLSNPSKFLPHFASLQAQGYEIVAGSGDVLVFRQVRSGPPVLERTESTVEAREKAAVEERKRVTNPIDGMQITPLAATGDFASPTGFVNHDLPRGSEVPFKSNIDVRREEPVFSGRRTGSEGSQSNIKSRGKRILVGAAWVAACSYAVGVVLEFFRIGGL
ncbi:conserved serine-threonine rich protein [Diplocarpon rosae]|nr:conserved serine-threonine rich protein [Diplocarpon rosae]